MIKLLNKELVMTKEDNQDFDNSNKCGTSYFDNSNVALLILMVILK